MFRGAICLFSPTAGTWQFVYPRRAPGRKKKREKKKRIQIGPRSFCAHGPFTQRKTVPFTISFIAGVQGKQLRGFLTPGGKGEYKARVRLLQDVWPRACSRAPQDYPTWRWTVGRGALQKSLGKKLWGHGIITSTLLIATRANKRGPLKTRIGKKEGTMTGTRVWYYLFPKIRRRS